MKIRTLFVICFLTGILFAGCGAGAPVNTPTPAYTPTPPNTTTADLSNISLKAEDLPEGFHLFTEDEIKSMGVTNLTSMFNAFGGGANLMKTDLYGKNPETIELLMVAFFYPLSPELIGKLDLGFLTPEKLVQSMQGAAILPNLSGIGDGSMGISQVIEGTKMNFLLIRRNNILIVLVEVYQSETSPFDYKAIGQKMDQYVLAEYK